MNEYLITLIYTAIGIIGAYFHYVKKRYKGDVQMSVVDYVMLNMDATILALGSIILAEASIAQIIEGEPLSLANVILAATTGFSLDSGLNKAEK